ncbi:MAG: hypothetical protein ACYTEZ_04095 [Planctomycetota bacterium]
MRRLLLFGLLAACGRGAKQEQESEIPADGVKRVLIVATAGTVRITTHDSPSARLEAYTEPSSHVAKLVEFGLDDDGILVTPLAEAEIDLVVPHGIDLKVLGATADVAVRGSWARLDVRTATGMIEVDVDRVTGGTVASTGGRVSFTARAGPREDLTCSSAMGDVSLVLPATYRGRIYLNTRTGSLRVPEQKGLRVTWGPDNRTVLAFAGEAMTDAARRRELETYGSPQAVRATSAAGTVAVRLAD